MSKVEQINLNEENRIFYRKMMRIGIPVLIQQIISIGLNLVDTIMVGKVSENALAAVGAANQVYFIFSVVLFGIFSGAAVHSVQYWGIGDVKSLRKILGIDYLMCVVLALPTVVLVYALAPQVIGLFSDEGEVVLLGAKYLRIACFSYFFSGMSFVISYNSRVIQDLKLPTTINAIAIGINIVLNYALIYGHLGMPKLGVEGAALATLIARIIECMAMVTSVYLRKEHPLKAKFGEMKTFSKELFCGIMATAIPVIITEGLWALSVSLTFAAYGKISASALAIVQIAVTVTDFFQTVYFGVGNASSVIIGEALGQGRKERAWRYSRHIMKITWGLNLAMTLCIILIRKPVALIYDFNPSTTELLMKALLVYAIAMTPKMLDYMLICGILRAGGDTLYSMYMDVGFNMGVQVPLAFIGVLALNLPLHWAIALVAVADFIKIFFCYQRYYSRKWMNVITDVDTIEEETYADIS
ncbi:MAG: MATE family efflux transporter [Firmicutes bacterium]|nr:MATE family efflux transporter [Bacillota bacterium]